jgi:hypothetical protein
MNHQLEFITGYDNVVFYLNDDVAYSGYFVESPLRERLLHTYTSLALKSENHKHYCARWMISENELLLGYVNGIFGGKELHTDDIVPEYPDEIILHHYTRFTGILEIIIQEIQLKNRFEQQHFNNKKLILDFKEGNLNSILRNDLPQ